MGCVNLHSQTTEDLRVPGHLSVEPDNTRVANTAQYHKKVFVPFLMSYVLYLSHLLHHASDHQINLDFKDKCNLQM